MTQTLGEGTFGVVVCRDGKAYKTYRCDNGMEYGIPHDILRELSALALLPPHANVVQGHIEYNDWIATPPSLVMPVAECSLHTFLVQHRRANTLGEIQWGHLLRHVLHGMAHVHQHGILHRDLKTHNILVYHTTDSVHPQRAVVADFGSAKLYLPGRTNSSGVCTLCYTAPEVLLGEVRYNYAVDVWSIGVVALELMYGHHPCKGDSEWGQLMAYFRITGTPTKQCWPALTELPYYNKEWPRWRRENSTFAGGDEVLRTVIAQALVCDPLQRSTCQDLLSDLHNVDCKPSLPASEGAAPIPSLRPKEREWRKKAICWMFRSRQHFRLSADSLHLAISLLDTAMTMRRLQRVHHAAILWIVMKLNEPCAFSASSVCKYCQYRFTILALITAESNVLKGAQYCLWKRTVRSRMVFPHIAEAFFADVSLFCYPREDVNVVRDACSRLARRTRCRSEGDIDDRLRRLASDPIILASVLSSEPSFTEALLQVPKEGEPDRDSSVKRMRLLST